MIDKKGTVAVNPASRTIPSDARGEAEATRKNRTPKIPAKKRPWLVFMKGKEGNPITSFSSGMDVFQVDWNDLPELFS